MTYTVVLLDGKERQNLSLEEVKDLFFKRQINQNSLVSSPENPQWQMLKRVFDVSNWIPTNAPQTPPPANYQNLFQPQNTFQPQTNPFAQTNQPPSNPFQPQHDQFVPPSPINQPVTFNQFPPNPNNQTNNNYNQPTSNFAQNTSNGYSQNNQSETYYQAETNQSQYNFQNNQANFAPSNYNNPPSNYNYSPNNNNNSQNSNILSGSRIGLRPAAIFLIVNALLNIVLILLENMISSSAANSAQKMGGGIGRFAISLIIDLVLAVKLWKNEDVETARKWVLVRTYLGFIVYGIAFPIFSINTGEVLVGVINFVAYLLFFISVTLVLHGKQSPAPSRVMAGIGAFVIFFLFNFGILGLSSIAIFAPNLAQYNFSKTELDQYKVEGKEFEDKTTGAKVVLPEGWSMLSLSNPLIHTPEARMIAVDKPGNRLTMLEVVPVPGNLDMKQANSAFVLDKLADGVVNALKEQSGKKSSSFSKNSFTELSRMNTYVGKHPAKMLIFDKISDGEKVKGHMIITYDELTFYVLHSWCPAAEYDKAQSDFTFFEKNFMVPDKINSPFTQSAETEKNKPSPKKNF